MDVTLPMNFPPVIYIIVLVVHILSSCVAVGAVAVVDYLHLIGLQKRQFEKKIIFVYPFLSKIINLALLVILVSGLLLVVNRPELVHKTLFQIKMGLVIILTLNGWLLQKKIGPHVERLIKHDLAFPEKWLIAAAACGAISIVSWFSTLILALTKNTGYLWYHFIPGYIGAIIVVFAIALFVERRAHSRGFVHHRPR